MCGRYAAFREAQDLADAFDIEPDDIADDARALPPSWNVAPTDPVRVVVERAPHPGRDEGAYGGADDAPGGDVRRALRLARWGLVPGWAKDPSIGSRMINARVESLADRSAFRRAVAARRCLVPAEGYYEWRKPPAGSPAKTPKQPFWIHDPSGGPLALAGLYEFWRDPERADDDPHRWLVTMTIITGGAPTDDPALAEIHDRRPIILPADRWADWLDPTQQDPAVAVDLLRARGPRLVPTPVSTEVNSVRTNGPELIEPIELPDAAEQPTLDLG